MTGETPSEEAKLRADLGSIKTIIETESDKPDTDTTRQFKNDYVHLEYDKETGEYLVIITDKEPYESRGEKRIGSVATRLIFNSALQIKDAVVAPIGESGFSPELERDIPEPGRPRFVAHILEQLQKELPS